MTITELPIASLYEGALVDLEAIRDWLHCFSPSDCEDCAIVDDMIRFEYAYVEELVVETSDCILLCTSLGSFGLPPDLLVPVIH